MELVDSWLRALRSENKSPRTIESYTEGLAQFGAFMLADRGLVDPTKVEAADVRAFIQSLLDSGRSPATAGVRYRAVQAFFRWLAAEGEIDPDRNPTLNVRSPKIGVKPVPVLTDRQVRALLRTCEGGKSFIDKRDTAILRLFLATGIRLSELAHLTLDDLDLDNQTVQVVGKGNKRRVVPFGSKATTALDRYLRVRRSHKLAARPELWLGPPGRQPMSDGGIAQMVRRRGVEAGIEGLHPHMFRHHFASDWLAHDGGETNLLRLAGWSSPQMLARYGASVADERARDAHRRLSLDDRF